MGLIFSAHFYLSSHLHSSHFHFSFFFHFQLPSHFHFSSHFELHTSDGNLCVPITSSWIQICHHTCCRQVMCCPVNLKTQYFAHFHFSFRLSSDFPPHFHFY